MKSVVLGGKGALALAVVLGSLTSFLVWKYVSEASQNAKPVETTPIVVAAAPIPARSVVKRDMVRVQQVPVETRLAGATASFNDVVGKVARTELQPGEQVLSSKLYLQRQESGLAFMVPDGQRAVSVGFTEIIGSGGLITPGDHVDVIGVFEVGAPAATPTSGGVMQSGHDQAALPGAAGSNSSFVATMVLQDVEVLAVAQRLQGEDTRDTSARVADSVGSGSAASASNGSGQTRSQTTPQPTAKTATLSVSPDDALRLVLAEEHGKIRLALRRAAETTPSDASPKLARAEAS